MYNMVDTLFGRILRKEDTRASLSALRAEIKEELPYSRAKELAGNGEALEALLDSQDAKVRKNAAGLLGDLGLSPASGALFAAYQKEETLFVRPALLQALKKTGAKPYLPELKARYDFLCGYGAPDEEKKHIREEIRILGQILRTEEKRARHTFTGWDQRRTVLLTAVAGYANVTKEQLAASRTKLNSLGVQAVVDSLRDVVKIRTFRDLLFPIGLGAKLTLQDGPQAFGSAVAESGLLALLLQSHKEPPPFYFRLDMKGKLPLNERSRYVKLAAAAIEEKSGRKLINAPEGYEFELRIMFDRDERMHLFLRMATIPMDRFAYRKETVATSIHPSFAATLLMLAKPYLKKDAQVLDPCCGVGTMLVERHKLLPIREAYGIDIFGEAVDKAKINTRAAGMHVNFIHKDYLDFKHGYLFDEIIANMPTLRKRVKEEQDAFYKGFFDQSQKLLAPDGVMLLYSNENGFVKKQLRLHPKLRLCKEYLISEKESFYFYIIGIKHATKDRRNDL